MSEEIQFKERPSTQPLVVNTDPANHYKIEKSETDGIRDLHRMTSNTKFEEGWIFINAVDRSGKTRTFWYEVAEQEQSYYAEIPTNARASILKDLKRNGFTLKEARTYHIHPRELPPQITLLLTQSGVPEKILGPGTAYPSEPDYLFTIREIYAWKSLGLKQFTTGTRIVTPFGLWSFDWRKAPPDTTRETDESRRFESSSIAAYQGLAKFILKEVRECLAKPVCTPNHTAAEKVMSTEWLRATFQNL